MTTWRDIPSHTVDWVGWSMKVMGAKRHGYTISRFTRGKNKLHPNEDVGEWHTLNLGQIADLGVRGWLRMPGIGDKSVTLLMAVIDAAAEGQPVSGIMSDAYVPRCERDATAPYPAVKQ